MSDMDEMVGAFFASPHTPLNRDEDEPWVVLAIAAALAAAPTVDRLLAYFPGQTADSDEAWACWAIANLAPSDESGWVATLPRDCRALECPGPHRTLLLGPEVAHRSSEVPTEGDPMTRPTTIEEALGVYRRCRDDRRDAEKYLRRAEENYREADRALGDAAAVLRDTGVVPPGPRIGDR